MYIRMFFTLYLYVIASHIFTFCIHTKLYFMGKHVIDYNIKYLAIHYSMISARKLIFQLYYRHTCTHIT